MEHQKLIEFLEREQQDRNLDYQEFAALLGMSPQAYANLRSYKRPGLQVCLDIARALKARPDLILYYAGHITEDELDAPQQIPPELLPTIQKLARMRGTPFFDTALELIEDVIDRVNKLFRIAA